MKGHILSFGVEIFESAGHDEAEAAEMLSLF
jgi:hypothetical protein